MRVLNFDQLKPEKGIPYSHDHLRRLVKAGKFPKPLALGPGRIAWVEKEVDAFLEARAEARAAA